MPRTPCPIATPTHHSNRAKTRVASAKDLAADPTMKSMNSIGLTLWNTARMIAGKLEWTDYTLDRHARKIEFSSMHIAILMRCREQAVTRCLP